MNLICAGIAECLHIFLRLNDHEVHVADFFICFRDLCYHRQSKTDIWNKAAIHDIEVQPLCFAGVDHITFLLKL